MVVKKRILYFLFVIIIFSLVGCSNKPTKDDEKAKINEELNYLDTKIVSILNKLNNISLQNYTITSEEVNLGEKGGSSGKNSGSDKESTQNSESEGQEKQSGSQSKLNTEQEKSNITTTQMESKTVLETDENDIDWKLIKTQIEIINEAWAVIVIDLSNLNVNSTDILDFSSTLDKCIISIKDENKVDSLKNAADLYAIIPKLEKAISNEDNIKQVKSYIINAYALVEQENWGEVEKNIIEAENIFKNITSNIEYMKNKEYKVNKTYVLIKELQNSLQYKDKKIFYIKYKDLLENINTL